MESPNSIETELLHIEILKLKKLKSIIEHLEAVVLSLLGSVIFLSFVILIFTSSLSVGLVFICSFLSFFIFSSIFQEVINKIDPKIVSCQVKEMYTHFDNSQYDNLSLSPCSATGFSLNVDAMTIFFNFRGLSSSQSKLLIKIPIKLPSFEIKSSDLKYLPKSKTIPFTGKLRILRKNKILDEVLKNQNLANYLQTVDKYFVDRSIKMMISSDKKELQISLNTSEYTIVLEFIPITLEFYQSEKSNAQNLQFTQNPLHDRPPINDDRYCVICYQSIADDFVTMACCQALIHISHYHMITKRCPYCKQPGVVISKNSSVHRLSS